MELKHSDMIWLISALGDYGRDRARKAAEIATYDKNGHLTQTVDRAVAFYEREARRAELMTDKLKKELKI